MSDISKASVEEYLLNNPGFVKEWFLKNVGREQLVEWVRDLGCPNGLDVTRVKRSNSDMWMTSGSARNSVTGNMFQDLIRGKRKKPTVAKSKRSLQQMTEKDLFLELIRDIANELDVNIVCHKILVNVSILTKSDRGSLFLARGRGDQRCLVSKLFDVSEHSTVDDSVCDEDSEITIPFGKGIAGTVALTKETINIKNAYEDPRFNQEVDLKTGYRTRSILCLPILNYEGETIGVAQIMNKTDGEQEFSEQDERVFRDYLTFCGIGLTNAQLFEMSVMEYKRNQMLLNLAKGIFEEQSNLDNLVQKIMLEAQDLLKCERCYVYLIYNSLEMGNTVMQDMLDRIHSQFLQQQFMVSLNAKDKFVSEKHADALKKLREAKAPPKQAFTHPQNVRFSKVFRLNAKNSGIVDYPSPSDLENSPNAEIAKEIVTTGQVLNVTEATTDPKFGKLIEDYDGFKAKTLVCVPIKNSEGKVIGVVQLMNKANGKHFNDNDIHVLEAFAIFCGLGIHNCQMYESACKLMAKQTVALEVLSYHATAAQEETDKLKAAVIPESEEYKLYTFDFSDFPLSDDDTCKATIRMFLDSGVVNKFHVPYEVLCRWTLSVKKNYRPVIYHNWRHAFNVAQTMFTMFYTGNMGRLLTELEVFSLLVACLCHDLDHRGTNNAFQSKVESPLALLYSTSTMEHHHFDHCIMILNSEGNNIFQHLSPEDYKEAIRILESGILSTDLALYFKKRGGFVELVEKGEKEWKDPQKRDLLRGMMMTACDVAAICKPWEVQREVAQLVASEFFEQGDLERSKLHLEPIAMMDRQKKDELPKMQVGFIDAICMPVYKILSQVEHGLKPLLEGCENNRIQWQTLASQQRRISSNNDRQEEGGNSQEDAPSEEKKNSSSTNGHMSSSLEPSDDKTKVDNSRTEIQLQSPQKKHKIDGKQPTKHKTDGKEPKGRRQQESRTCALL